MTDTTIPATLPVVAWLHIMDSTEGIPGNAPSVAFTSSKRNPFGKPGVDYSRSFPVTHQPLTPQAPAQEVLEALRAEVESMRRWIANDQAIIDKLRAERDAARDAATGRIAHVFNGMCPDEIEGPDVRDSDCPACRAIGLSAAMTQEGEGEQT